MGRPKKKAFQSVAIKMDQAVYDRLCAYCDAEYRTKTATIELALSEYFDKYDESKSNAKKASGEQ